MDKEKPKKILLAYSGGLDTSVILAWLKEKYGAEIIAFCADIGQKEELTGLEEKGKKTGASKVIIKDLRLEFAKDFIFPAIQGSAIYEMRYLLGTSLARPLIAKAMAEVAFSEKADSFSHGATGKGNDQVRFELGFKALAPELQIIAPWRIWEFQGRKDLIEYAKSKGIPVPVTVEKPYSMDRNLLHLSFEGGVLEDPFHEPKEEMFLLTTSPEKAPDTPEIIEIDYEKGNPVAVNGKKMGPAELLACVNQLGGKHGIGRVDLVENRFVGMKSRGVYETPGGSILHVAHRAVESLTMDREVLHLRDSLIPRYAELVYYGFWYAPERQILQTMIDESQVSVAGTARLKLYKGNVTLLGRKASKSLFNPELATFEKDSIYCQADAEGFIKLNALRLRMRRLAGLS
ncbi:MAG: argininosuccinate synthase [Leptospiraceae bacterium]|nr:argininosuccinate synthase [Leptospiraceae bacterium]